LASIAIATDTRNPSSNQKHPIRKPRSREKPQQGLAAVLERGLRLLLGKWKRGWFQRRKSPNVGWLWPGRARTTEHPKSKVILLLFFVHVGHLEVVSSCRTIAFFRFLRPAIRFADQAPDLDVRGGQWGRGNLPALHRFHLC